MVELRARIGTTETEAAEVLSDQIHKIQILMPTPQPNYFVS